MFRAWIYVLLGGLLEIPWIIGLKHADRFWMYGVVACIIGLSFYLLMKSYEYLPVSTVYPIFTGIGAAGIVVTEIVAYGAPVSILKILFISAIICGVIGLKLTTKEH